MDTFGAHARQGLPDADEVFERLAHFETLNTEVPRVKEVVHPLLAAAFVIIGLSLESRALKTW